MPLTGSVTPDSFRVLAAGAAAAGAIADTGPDAELLRFCAEFISLTRAKHACMDYLLGDEEWNKFAAPVDDRLEEIRDEICDLQAMTLEGFRALGRAIIADTPGVLTGEDDASQFDRDLIVALLHALAA